MFWAWGLGGLGLGAAMCRVARCVMCVMCVIYVICVICVMLLLLASFVEGTARVVAGNSATTGRDNESQSSGLDAGSSSLSSLASCFVACTTYGTQGNALYWLRPRLAHPDGVAIAFRTWPHLLRTDWSKRVADPPSPGPLVQ